MKYFIPKDQIIFASLFAFVYFLWNYFIIGLKPDHLLFILFISGGSLIHRNIFKFYLGFSAFTIFWIIYDGMQVYPNYDVNPVSIQEIFDLEKHFFGFNYNGEKIILNEYFLDNQMPLLSFFLGLAYLMWMPAPWIFSIFLYITNRKLLLRYSFCFLFVNLLGFIGYYLYPAAPPWYFFEHGTELHTNISGSAGLLTNFDAIVGYPIFDSIYNRGSNVFAAMPSLHSAFTLVNLYYAFKSKNRYFIVAFSFLALGTWVGAVYSLHHYVIDVILGIFTAILALVLYEKIEFSKIFSPLINRISKIIILPETEYFV
ncbi:MAG: phosphatase PAP2 family protein [Saprospiraceae bacterium]